jgi:hypothetical protein
MSTHTMKMTGAPQANLVLAGLDELVLTHYVPAEPHAISARRSGRRRCATAHL